jgi:hypothetical protein
VLCEIAAQHSLAVTWNFFGEYHGKNIVDGHFGLVSRWLREGERSRPISSMEECMAFLREQVDASNMLRSAADRLCVHLIRYDRAERPQHKVLLQLTGFSTYQCFTSTSGVVTGYTTSQQLQGTVLKGKVVRQADERRTKRPPVRPVVSEYEPPPQGSRRKQLARELYFAKQFPVDALCDSLAALSL